jgi:hypothetical protein
MSEFYIRINTKHFSDTTLPVWKVIKDGQLHLVNGLKINTPVESVGTIEDGSLKWNLHCTGEMNMVDGVAHITPED